MCRAKGLVGSGVGPPASEIPSQVPNGKQPRQEVGHDIRHIGAGQEMVGGGEGETCNWTGFVVCGKARLLLTVGEGDRKDTLKVGVVPEWIRPKPGFILHPPCLEAFCTPTPKPSTSTLKSCCVVLCCVCTLCCVRTRLYACASTPSETEACEQQSFHTEMQGGGD